MIVESINCDVCGAERQESNHWILAFRDGWRTVEFHPWSDKDAREQIGVKHLCGRECAQKYLDQVLGETDANAGN